MSLLEAAKRIRDEIDPACQGQGRCIFCYCLTEPIRSAGIEAESHAADCPWLTMPQIVAVLEAAKRAVADFGGEDARIWDDDEAVLSPETARALQAAMKGSTPT